MKLVTVRHIDSSGTMIGAFVYNLDSVAEATEMKARLLAGASLAGQGWSMEVRRTGPAGYREAYTVATGDAGRTL
jgi:hypothetical protein